MRNNCFGIKEVADVIFYEINKDGTKGEEVLWLDTLKVSNLEFTAQQSDAKGGKGNAPLITWDYGREANVVLEDALLSQRSLALAYGNPLENFGRIVISANVFPGVYWLEGKTFARDMDTGEDEIFTFIIPKAKIQSENSITMEAEGDPTVFNLSLKVLRGTDGTMVKLIKGGAEPEPGPTPSEGLLYSLINNDTEYEVTGLSEDCIDTNIVIPSTYNGKPVTAIGDSAFYECYSLTSIIIPDSVTSIGISAFEYCENLTSVTIGNSVTAIPDYAFYGCIGLISITIPDSVTSIGYSAFAFCYYASLTIPDSVTSIGGSAFYGCSNLTSITIPDSVTSIGNSAFCECTSLTGIYVDANNPNYSNDAYGVLFSKDKTQLIQAPGGLSDSYSIPEGVTSIGSEAFVFCTGLTSVTIPHSVTSIGSEAFGECYSLRTILINKDRVHDIEGCPWGATNVTVIWNGQTDQHS